MSKSFVNYNGSIAEASQPLFTSSNRGFRYGDAVFETIRLMNGEILYFEKHLERLNRSMELLGMLPHKDLTFHNLYLSIRHLDQINLLKGNGRIRLQVFRNDGGLYTPQVNDVSYIIEATPITMRSYKLNDTGLKIDLYTEIPKPVSRLSNLKSSNSLYYVMAGLYKRKMDHGDCLVLNTSGRIAEAISSNIFITQGKTVITPSLSEACVAGVMRENVMEIVERRGMKMVERGIETGELTKSDEIFLTDVIHGIRWVGAFRNKRYFNSFSRSLLESINEEIQLKKV